MYGTDKNVGGVDRIARLVLGGLLVVAAPAGVLGYDQLGLMVGLAGLPVGAILLVTGAIQRCPLWAVARINTLRT